MSASLGGLAGASNLCNWEEEGAPYAPPGGKVERDEPEKTDLNFENS
jgi:hypothetical protein